MMTKRRSFNSPNVPKPYDFVPFVQPVSTPTVGHETIRGQGFNTGSLTYQIEVLSPLFISGGSYLLTDSHKDPVVRDFYRVNGQPTIPGSSLKGVVRSVIEAISPSCVTTTRLDLRLLPHRSHCQADKACPACSMFGRMSRMSKLTFIDAGLARGNLKRHRLPALYGPRAHQAPKTYQDKGEYKGRKFYFHGNPSEDDRQPPVEVAPPQSLFRSEFQFENLSDAELGLFFVALGLDTTFTLKMGGGKPTCLGSIRIQPGTLTLITTDDFLQAEAQTTPLSAEAMVEAMVEKIRVAYRKKLILRLQLEKLREIWHFPNDRNCPEGMY
ncbi:RAMP superfamily CRISPR-associated protein [Chloroflexota bacterium]